MKKESYTRPPLDSLACVEPSCTLYGQSGQDNLSIRKVYGQDQIRYLRCGMCGREFSERKNTALWNSKINEARAVAVAAQLAEGSSFAATARLCGVDRSTVERLNRCVGQHAHVYHNQRVQGLNVQALQADERHGFAGTKGHAAWEAEVMDPVSKFILSHVQGRRTEGLIRTLLSDAAQRLTDRHDLVLFTDGEASYATLFPELFGCAYQPVRRGSVGRRPQVRYRIPRTLAHVQLIKHRSGYQLTHVEIRYTHGSRRRVQQALAHLSYRTPNTSAIERRNGTARRMSAFQVRKSLAFAHRPDTKVALGWWGLTVYNWARSHRSLRQALPEPLGKKSSSLVRLRWPWAWRTVFFRSKIFF